MGIQRVTDAVAQEIEGHDHQSDGNTGNQRQMRRRSQCRKAVADHHAPGSCGRFHAQTQEAHGGLGQDDAAQAHGADYLGVGAVFSTSTKLDAKNVSHETLKEICKAVRIPVVAIGGITRDNVKELTGCGADGIAVISAVFAQQDIESAARELKKCSEEMVKG